MYGVVLVRTREGDGDRVVNPREHELETLMHRVNNAFIHRLGFSFMLDDLHLPYYLRANANDLQCRVGVLNIHAEEAKIDYALVDFLGVYLEPHVYKMSTVGEPREDHIMLFTHT